MSTYEKLNKQIIFYVSTFIDWYILLGVKAPIIGKKYSQSSEKITANRRKKIRPIVGNY